MGKFFHLLRYSDIDLFLTCRVLVSCDVDIHVVSFDFAPNLGYPFRVGELFVDARCDLQLFYHPY